MNVLQWMGLAAAVMLPLAAWGQPPMGGGHLALFDGNKDGQITPEEVKAVRGSHFDLADGDHDGKLTLTEVAQLPRLGRGMGIVARADADRDGVLTREEFLAATPPRLAGQRGMGAMGWNCRGNRWW